MSAGADKDGGGDPELVTIDLEITKQQKEEIDRVWRSEGYPSRSEYVRDVLREASRPILTEQALEDVATGLADKEEGRTVSFEMVKSELGLDDE